MEVGKRTGYNVVDGIAWCTGEEASGRGSKRAGRPGYNCSKVPYLKVPTTGERLRGSVSQRSPPTSGPRELQVSRGAEVGPSAA